MMRVPLIAMLALPIAACGSGGERAAATANTTANAAAPDAFLARVRALSPAQRDGVLLRAIRDAGQTCQQVTKSTAVGEAGDAPTWAATCDDGGVWIVAFNPGGVATVTAAPTRTGG